MERDAAVVLAGDLFSTPSAKTAHGLVRGPSRYEIVGVVDATCAGRDAGEVLEGKPRGIPVFASLDAALAGAAKQPQWVVVGVATSGGVLPPELRAAVRAALDRGLGVVNGLHELVGDDPEFAAAAAKSGAKIVDIRRPKKRAELHFWTGAIRNVRAPRVAVIGTDCALGKRTTSQLLAAALRARGVATELVHTGQTGWLQGCRFGFVLDATPNDFVTGELEHAIVSCDREVQPDLILLEGQSALRNPSGPCGAELLLSGGASGVVLQHAPARKYFDDQEHLENEIPSLASEVALIGMYGVPVLGVTLNHEHLPAADRPAAAARAARETGLPVCYPLLDGVAPLLPALERLAAAARAR
jgi:uncharacterized NAD-dependent epimerase/dehydratase family protein